MHGCTCTFEEEKGEGIASREGEVWGGVVWMMKKEEVPWHTISAIGIMQL